MPNLRCMIVDDEPLAQEVVETYVAKYPGLEKVGTYSDAFQAMEALRSQEVDVMFLDINMPGLSGLSLLRSLARPPLVIFTTAYPEYAVEGFELDAVDYLLKPFSFERFVRAVEKVSKLLRPATQPGASEQHLLIKADRKLFRISLQDIIYIESIGDYVKVHLDEKVLVSKERLKIIEGKLPDDLFIRIHKSFLCSWQKVQYLEGNRLKVGEKMLPIGQTYKKKLMARLGEKG